VTATATKTLEATLAPPTAHKEQRLQRTVATYRRALTESFESGAETQSAVNDVVTGYNLTSYAKDALKNYVPQLRRTYNAEELSDDHPVRFTNRGFRSTTPRDANTGSVGAFRRPDVATPSGFHSASTPRRNGSGRSCLTAT